MEARDSAHLDVGHPAHEADHGDASVLELGRAHEVHGARGTHVSDHVGHRRDLAAGLRLAEAAVHGLQVRARVHRGRSRGRGGLLLVAGGSGDGWVVVMVASAASTAASGVVAVGGLGRVVGWRSVRRSQLER